MSLLGSLAPASSVKHESGKKLRGKWLRSLSGNQRNYWWDTTPLRFLQISSLDRKTVYILPHLYRTVFQRLVKRNGRRTPYEMLLVQCLPVSNNTHLLTTYWRWDSWCRYSKFRVISWTHLTRSLRLSLPRWPSFLLWSSIQKSKKEHRKSWIALLSLDTYLWWKMKNPCHIRLRFLRRYYHHGTGQKVIMLGSRISWNKNLGLVFLCR